MAELSNPVMYRGAEAKPLATVLAKVPASSREDFFSRLRQYATDQKFQISIQKNPHFPECYDIGLRREDFWILGDSLFDPLTFELAYLPAPPHWTAPKESAETAALDLINALNQAAGISASLMQ